MNLAKSLDELLGVGEVGDRDAEVHGRVLADPPVDEVCVWQVRDDAAVGEVADHIGDHLELVEQVGVREFDALGVAGGAARVDQREHVRAFNLLVGGVEVEVGRCGRGDQFGECGHARRAVRRVDDHDVC